MKLKEYRKLSELSINDKNPRGIKKKDFERLKKQIQKLGMYKPVLITPEGKVLGGNMRVRAYNELGIEDVWVSVVSPKDKTEEMEYILSDNDRAGYWEEEDLAELITNLPELELGTYAIDIGEPKDLSDFMKDFAPEVVEDDVPEVSDEEPVSKYGEVYQLGRHRLMCGDSTKIEDVEKLMNGQKADMVFTDPPYGISLNNDWQNNIHRYNNKAKGGIVNDSGELDLSILKNYKRRIVFGFPYLQDEEMSGWLVWDKEPSFKGRSLTSPVEMAYSTIWKGFKIERLLWSGYMREGNEEKVGHPTQKPIKLITNILEQYKDNNILDLFGGSGSTLIACEQLNRTCYMMELDPKYCDVIRKRYAKFIGKEDEWEKQSPKVE